MHHEENSFVLHCVATPCVTGMKESCDPETKDAKILYTLSEVFQALIQLFGAIKKMLSLEINYLLRVVWIPQASPNCSCSYIYLQC